MSKCARAVLLAGAPAVALVLVLAGGLRLATSQEIVASDKAREIYLGEKFRL